MDEILELEKKGWEALSTSGDAGVEFYGSLLRDDAIMVFPGGMEISGKENILESFGARPWKTFKIEDPREIELIRNVRVLIYRITAQREGDPPYQALISSTYVSENGGWKLVHHQQSPV